MTRPLSMPSATPERRATVSDHALLRWLERHLLIDIEAVRESILTPERLDAIRCGAARIHCRAEGVVLVVAEDGTIKTVLPTKALRK